MCVLIALSGWDGLCSFRFTPHLTSPGKQHEHTQATPDIHSVYRKIQGPTIANKDISVLKGFLKFIRVYHTITILF